MEVRTIDEGGRSGVFLSFTKKCLAALGISASRKRLSGSDVFKNGEFELAAPGGGTLHISGAYKSDCGLMRIMRSAGEDEVTRPTYI